MSWDNFLVGGGDTIWFPWQAGDFITARFLGASGRIEITAIGDVCFLAKTWGCPDLQPDGTEMNFTKNREWTLWEPTPIYPELKIAVWHNGDLLRLQPMYFLDNVNGAAAIIHLARDGTLELLNPIDGKPFGNRADQSESDSINAGNPECDHEWDRTVLLQSNPPQFRCRFCPATRRA